MSARQIWEERAARNARKPYADAIRVLEAEKLVMRDALQSALENLEGASEVFTKNSLLAHDWKAHTISIRVVRAALGVPA